VAFSSLFTVHATLALAASYALSPASGSYSVGETFQVRVVANTTGQPVNTGEATISYDTTKLTAVSVSKDGSPFNLWVTGPVISSGAINFAGGGTTALSGSPSVVTITFKAETEGVADLSFTKATLLAGAGQNVLTGSTGASYMITAVAAASPPDPTTQPVETSGFGAIYWVLLLFMAALAVVVTMFIQEWRRNREEKDRIKRETMEAGDKLINIFGVLRDEMEEKVLHLSRKPNMTDNEHSILEGLKDALDVSEKLIDKEIGDVRKLLK
jgi:hypothetical protein